MTKNVVLLDETFIKALLTLSSCGILDFSFIDKITVSVNDK